MSEFNQKGVLILSQTSPFSKANFNPLIIRTIENSDTLLYDISSPYMIMLETCRESDGLYSIFRFSPNDYQSLFFSEEDHDVMTRRPLHKHSFVEIMYVISGSVTNYVEDQVFTYEAGQCCVMNKNIYHSEQFSGEFQVVFFSFQDEYLRDLLSEYSEKGSQNKSAEQTENLFMKLLSDSGQSSPAFDKTYLDCFPLKSPAEIHEHLSPIFNTLITEALNQKPGAGFFVKGSFCRLLCELSNPEYFSIKRVHSDLTGQEFLFTKISHIMKASHGRCTRDELSAQLHYNGEYLNRIVKKYTGQTLLSYGQSIYLDEAKDLLLHTDKSISTIIEELGFSNRTHFYRLFEKKFGQSPSDYRKSR